MTLHLISMPMPAGERLLWGVGPAVDAASYDPGLASLSRVKDSTNIISI